MKVAFDIGPLGPQPAGVGVYASSLGAALAELTPGRVGFIGRKPEAQFAPDDAEILDRPARPYLFWLQWHAMRDARRINADLAHFSDGVAPLRRSIPIVLAVHDLSVVTMPRSHPLRRWARIPLVALSPRLATRVIVPSRATADEVLRVTGVSARKVVVSPYAANRDLRPAGESEIDAATRRYGLTAGSFILAVGTIEPRKNHLRLIRAFELAARTNRVPEGIELVLAGRLGWRYERTLQAIAESPVKDRIRTLGFVADDELAGLMSGAMSVAYVSLYEGFGLPVVEAMACGAPTIVSDVSSMPEVGGDAAFYVDPYSVTSIADGIARAREASPNRPSIARRAIEQASTFSWHRAAAEVTEVHEAALSGSP